MKINITTDDGELLSSINIDIKNLARQVDSLRGKAGDIRSAAVLLSVASDIGSTVADEICSAVCREHSYN